MNLTRAVYLWSTLGAAFLTYVFFAAYHDPNANVLTRFVIWLLRTQQRKWMPDPRTRALVYAIMLLVITLLEAVLVVLNPSPVH